ncbi:MAG: retroviral-like aspartic protease family protein [Sphingomicrobium sp.]
MTIFALPALVAALMGAQAVGPSAPTPAIAITPAAEDAATQSLAFRTDLYDRMTVGVTIAGQGPFQFMVDTGADRSAVSRALADRLGLKARAPLTLHSAAGVTRVSTVRVPDMQFATRDKVNIDAPILEARDMGADGILGVDALRTQRIILDFKAQRVFLTPTSKRERRLEPGEIVIRGTLRQGHLVVTDATMFGEHVTIVVDTGAQMSIGNPALFRLLRRARQVDSPLEYEQIAVTGAPLKGQLYTVSTLEVNDVTLHDLSLMIADAQTFKVLGRTSTPTLLLGMNALRAFERVEIDLSQKRMRLKLGELPLLLRRQEIAGSTERRVAGR